MTGEWSNAHLSVRRQLSVSELLFPRIAGSPAECRAGSAEGKCGDAAAAPGRGDGAAPAPSRPPTARGPSAPSSLSSGGESGPRVAG